MIKMAWNKQEEKKMLLNLDLDICSKYFPLHSLSPMCLCLCSYCKNCVINPISCKQKQKHYSIVFNYSLIH